MQPETTRKRNRIAAAFAAIVLGGQLGSGCAVSNEGPRGSSSQRSSLGIPCDPNRVLQNVCQHCHSAPPQNGAPFPLVTYEDTQALASGVPLWKFMRAVVQSGAMPLPPVQIDPAQRDLLLAWFDAGAPARSASDMCSDMPVDSSDSGDDASNVSTDGGADGGDAGSDTSDGGGDAPGSSTPEGGAVDGGAPESDAPADSDAAECADIDACTAGDDAPPE
jgi:hypothetical protein